MFVVIRQFRMSFWGIPCQQGLLSSISRLSRFLSYVVKHAERLKRLNILILQVFLIEYLYAVDDVVHSRLKKSLKKAHKWLRDYLFVWSTMLTLMLIVKTVYGEHRPHFLFLCQPDTKNCQLGTLVTNFTCTNQNITKFRMHDISSSFPSGHAALACYFSCFMIWFFQRRVEKLSVRYLIPFLQAVLVIYAAFVSVSRISDNAHHPSDVAFGSFLGFIFSIFCVRT